MGRPTTDAAPAPFAPLFSQAELDALCRSGTERMRDALAEGPDAARATYDALDGALRGFPTVYLDWQVLTAEYLLEVHGHAAHAAAPGPERVAELALRHGATLPDLLAAQRLVAGPEHPEGEAFRAAVAAGDADAALAAWSATEAGLRLAHDLRRDTLTDLMRHVHDAHGAEALVAAQRYAAERGWWRESMPEDRARDPADRLATLLFFLTVSGFCEFRVREEPDRWVLDVLTCGNCGRQLRDAYRPEDPWGLGVVQGPAPFTFGQPAVTTYQTHLAVIHHAFAIDTIGAPFPDFRCAGLAAGTTPCRWLVHKDLDRTDAASYALVGLTRPGSR